MRFLADRGVRIVVFDAGQQRIDRLVVEALEAANELPSEEFVVLGPRVEGTQRP